MLFTETSEQFTIAPPASSYTVAVQSTGDLLDMYGAFLNDGAQVAQWAANGGTNQRWAFVSAGGSYYNLVKQKSGKFLDVYGVSQADGAQVVQWTCNGGNNQQFQLQAAGNGFKLAARHSSKCIDLYAFSTAKRGSSISGRVTVARIRFGQEQANKNFLDRAERRTDPD